MPWGCSVVGAAAAVHPRGAGGSTSSLEGQRWRLLMHGPLVAALVAARQRDYGGGIVWMAGGGSASVGRRWRGREAEALTQQLASEQEVNGRKGVRNKRRWQLESWWCIKRRRANGSVTRGNATTSQQTRGKRGRDAPLLPCKPPPKHHTIKWDGGASGHEVLTGARQCCQQYKQPMGTTGRRGPEPG